MNRRSFLAAGGASAVLFPMPSIAAHRVIATHTDFSIPGDFDTLQAALSWLYRADFRHASRVNLLISGRHEPQSAVSLNQPEGRNIHIHGNSAVLAFQHGGTQPGLYVSAGHQFGWISGLTIELPEKAEFPYAGHGILVQGGGAVAHMRNVAIKNFHYSFAASMGGFLDLVRVAAYDPGDVGVFAYGATVHGRYCSVFRARDDVRDLGYGFMAEHGGKMFLDQPEAWNCSKSGFGSFSSSAMKLVDPVSKHNGHYAWESREGSNILKIRGEAFNNGRGEYGLISEGTITAG